MRKISTHLLPALVLMVVSVCSNAEQPNTPFHVDGAHHSYDLLTHRGTPFEPATVSGKVVLLVFGFTACPDVCPVELGRVSQVLSDIDADAIQALFVSLDPERDSAQNLADYLPYFHADIVGLTGDQAQITKLASSLGVRFSRIEQESGYSIDHSTGVFIIGSDGVVKAIAPLGSGVEHLKQIVLSLL